MLTSLLLFCLFFGLISMILPSDKHMEWIYLLLILILILSVGGSLVSGKVSFPSPESESLENSPPLPEKTVLHSAVSSRVFDLTGQTPLSVESDLERRENEYALTWIRVVIRDGNEKEVQDALQQAFSFEGFTVISPQEAGTDSDLVLSP